MACKSFIFLYFHSNSLSLSNPVIYSKEAGPLIHKYPDVRTTAHATENDAMVALQEYELRLNVISISTPPAPPPSPDPVHPINLHPNGRFASTSSAQPQYSIPSPAPAPGIVCLSFAMPPGQTVPPMTLVSHIARCLPHFYSDRTGSLLVLWLRQLFNRHLCFPGTLQRYPFLHPPGWPHRFCRRIW